MSTSHGRARVPIDDCATEDATPVCLDVESLESTAPEYLRDLKYDLARENLVPARLTTSVTFDTDCSFETQSQVEDLRAHVRTAAFLGAGTVTVSVDEVEDPQTVTPALEACKERARREGVSLEVDGPVDLD